MASEVRSFINTIPAGTQALAPFVTDMIMPPRIVEALEITVPPGPRGLVGFAIGAAGQWIFPIQAGRWIVTDNEEIHWPLEDQIDSGGWQFFGYNLGQFPHTIYVRFLVRPTTVPLDSGGVQPIPSSALSLSVPLT